MKLSEVKIGETFKVADIDFIKFSQEGDKVVAVAKNKLFNSTFGENNVFAKSKLLAKLCSDVLLKIEAAVGSENVLEFETDLISLDGLKTQGIIKTKISLPTFDFYRANIKLFDKFKLDDWWWLASPWSTSERLDDWHTVCVSPRGNVYGNIFDCNNGVRPILHFVSSISVSCEDE